MLDAKYVEELFRGGMKYSDIAKKLGVPVGQVSFLLGSLGAQREDYVRKRQIAWEMRQAGESLQSIADQVGLSPATVKTMLSKLKKIPRPARPREQAHERSSDQCSDQEAQ